MPQSVRILNDLPHAIECVGRHYEETKKLSSHQLALYIERDLFLLKKEFKDPHLNWEITVIHRQGRHHLRVGITANSNAFKDEIVHRVEQVLWGYNYQVLSTDKGRIKPTPPRFHYHIDFNVIDSNLIEIK